MITGRTKLRGAKYRRISDDREGRELGVKRQDEDLEELAQRHGIEVVADYPDNDISASTRSRKERPQYRQMIADAKAGHFDVILAYTSKRITRRPRENEDLIELGERYGIRFLYVKSPSFDLNTANGRMVARILAAADANESEEMAERIARKHREKAEAGEDRGGGSRPFGFEDDRVTIRESEAKHIRDAATRLLDDGASINGTVREWREKGLVTSTGKKWNIPSFRRMMKSARISGRREHRGVIVARAQWPEIITPEQSDRLRELLSDPARRTNTGDNARRYLLSGIIIHGAQRDGSFCGDKLKARPQNDHQRSYVCADLGRAHLRMHADSVELYVAEAALDYLDEFVNLAAAIRAGDDGERREAVLWQERDGLRRRLEKLDDDHYVHGRLDEQRHTRLTREIEMEIERVDADLNRVRGQRQAVNLPASSAHARRIWEDESTTFTWRRTFLTTLVERVTIGPGLQGRNTFDPDRVSITFRRPA